MKNGYKIIDSHCHIYPDKIALKAVNGTNTFYDVPFNLDGTIGTLRKVSAEAGVDHAVVQSVATTPKQVKSINEFIAETVKTGEGFFTGLGTLHPDSADQRGDVEHLVELGLRGVKLHPDIQKFKLDDYRCLKIYELCEEFDLPLLLHTGDNRYDYSNPNRLMPILDIYKNMRVIGAHLGGWSIWEEAVEQLHGRPNMWFDCSSTFAWLDNETVRRLILELGTDRVLFGTDYPMWTPKVELERFFELGLTKEQNEQILSENARKVFGIEKL